jgi:hypothetical protein
VSTIENKGNTALVRVGAVSNEPVNNNSQPISAIIEGQTIPLLDWNGEPSYEIAGANQLAAIEAEQRDGAIILLRHAPIPAAYSASKFDAVTGKQVAGWDTQSDTWKTTQEATTYWAAYAPSGDWSGYEWVRTEFRQFREDFADIFEIPSYNSGDTKAGQDISSTPKVVVASGSFGVSNADRITNYNPKTDGPIQIDLGTFDGAVGKLKIAKKSRHVSKLAKKSYDFIYDGQAGYLYYNENKAEIGFGEGGIIAILAGKPKVGPGNFEFI